MLQSTAHAHPSLGLSICTVPHFQWQLNQSQGPSSEMISPLAISTNSTGALVGTLLVSGISENLTVLSVRGWSARMGQSQFCSSFFQSSAAYQCSLSSGSRPPFPLPWPRPSTLSGISFVLTFSVAWTCLQKCSVQTISTTTNSESLQTSNLQNCAQLFHNWSTFLQTCQHFLGHVHWARLVLHHVSVPVLSQPRTSPRFSMGHDVVSHSTIRGEPWRVHLEMAST